MDVGIAWYWNTCLAGGVRYNGLYLTLTPNLRASVGSTNDGIYKFRKAVYGLVNAPRECFKRVTKELRKLNDIESDMGNCCFVLKHPKTNHGSGIGGVHVDDFIGRIDGNVSLQIAAMQKLLKFGTAEGTKFTGTRRQFVQLPKPNTKMTMGKFINDRLKGIPLPKQLRRQTTAAVTDHERNSPSCGESIDAMVGHTTMHEFTL